MKSLVLKNIGKQFCLYGIPLLLGLLFAILWYPLSSKSLVGWGEDPYFNLWTLEQVWKHLSSVGVLRIFSDEFWKTPIFSPFPDTLAFSENQVLAALVSWPIRVFTHNGVYAYNFLARLMSLATLLFTWRWLDSIGVRNFAVWGALFFQGCGWIQDQYAHFQNICIFVFPLALYAWSCLVHKPSYLRALLCAFCFGWVMGWNVYYQVFLNMIFSALVFQAFLRNEIERPLLFFLLGVTFLIEAPFAYRYLELEFLMGSLKVPMGDYISYSASPLSFLAHGEDAMSFLQRVNPFYPRVELAIENVGFLGITWTTLALFAIRDSRTRIFTLTALFFFWIALGPNFGLMALLKFFPGLHGARAIGRIQVLVVLFSLAGVILYIETLKPRFQPLLLALLLVELLPGGLSKQTVVKADLYGSQLSDFEVQLALLPRTQPLLVLPELKSEVQLSLSRSGILLLEGYSGRTPLSVHLLNQLSKDGMTRERLKQKLFFSKANYVVSMEDSLSQELKQYPFLSWQGCYAHFDFHPCLFVPKWALPEDLARLKQPILSLDGDTSWEYLPQKEGHKAILRANRDGILNYQASGKCWMEEDTYFRTMRLWKSKRALLANGFKGAEFKEGAVILEQESKHRKIYSIVCQSKRDRMSGVF